MVVENVLGGRFGDEDGEVLVLLVIAVEQAKLLMAVGGVVGGIQVEDHGIRQASVMFAKALDPGIHEEAEELP